MDFWLKPKKFQSILGSGWEIDMGGLETGGMEAGGLSLEAGGWSEKERTSNTFWKQSE